MAKSLVDICADAYAIHMWQVDLLDTTKAYITSIDKDAAILCINEHDDTCKCVNTNQILWYEIHKDILLNRINNLNIPIHLACLILKRVQWYGNKIRTWMFQIIFHLGFEYEVAAKVYFDNDGNVDFERILRSYWRDDLNLQQSDLDTLASHFCITSYCDNHSITNYYMIHSIDVRFIDTLIFNLKRSGLPVAKFYRKNWIVPSRDTRRAIHALINSVAFTSPLKQIDLEDVILFFRDNISREVWNEILSRRYLHLINIFDWEGVWHKYFISMVVASIPFLAPMEYYRLLIEISDKFTASQRILKFYQKQVFQKVWYAAPNRLKKSIYWNLLLHLITEQYFELITILLNDIRFIFYS